MTSDTAYEEACETARIAYTAWKAENPNDVPAFGFAFPKTTAVIADAMGALSTGLLTANNAGIAAIRAMNARLGPRSGVTVLMLRAIVEVEKEDRT